MIYTFTYARAISGVENVRGSFLDPFFFQIGTLKSLKLSSINFGSCLYVSLAAGPTVACAGHIIFEYLSGAPIAEVPVLTGTAVPFIANGTRLYADNQKAWYGGVELDPGSQVAVSIFLYGFPPATAFTISCSVALSFDGETFNPNDLAVLSPSKVLTSKLLPGINPTTSDQRGVSKVR